MRQLGTALAFACVSLWATLACAEPSGTDVALAESLFQEGQALMKQNRYAEACPKFQESQRLDPGGGTLFQLATCHTFVRQTASAWAEFVEVALLAKQRNRQDIEHAATDKARALEPELSRLTILVPPAAIVPGLTVRRDDTRLGSAAFGSAMPCDPGKHTVRVEAPGYLPWSVEVELGDHADQKTVTIETLEKAPPPPHGTRVETRYLDSARAKRSPALLYGAAGVTVVSVGVAGVFGYLSYSKERDANKRCPDTTCSDPGAVQLSKSAVSSANIANVAAAAGFVGLGVTIYLLATSPSASSASIQSARSKTGIHWAPATLAGPVSLGVSARF